MRSELLTPRGPKTRKSRGPYAKSEQRRREIVEAATSVFATRGYHGGSLRDIARELDLSLTSIVHHYNTKYWDSPKSVEGFRYADAGWSAVIISNTAERASLHCCDRGGAGTALPVIMEVL